LGALVHVGVMNIRHVGKTDLTGLSALSSAGLVLLKQVDALHDLRGLPALSNVGRLHLEANPALISLEGTRLDGGAAIDVEKHPHLVSLAGLEKVAHLQSLQINENPELTELPLATLRVVDETLYIRDNAS